MGRITFSSGTLGGATAATQAKYEALNGAAIIARFDAAQFNALGNYTFYWIGGLPGKDGFVVGLYTGDPGLFNVIVGDATDGILGFSTSFNRSTLPTSGDLILYAHKFAGSRAAALFTADGTLLGEVSQTGVVPLPTGAGTGTIRVGNDGTNARSVNIDAWAVLSATRSGVARFAKPLPTDPDVVGIYYFPEGTGTTTADAVSGGSALTLSNNTWASPGVWDEASAPSTGPTVTAVSPTSGRATGTVVDITVDDSTGATDAAVNGDPLVSFSIVNSTTVRGTTDGATTGAVTVTNGDGTGTGPTFTVVPIATEIRFQNNTAPWAPADGPFEDVPYTITLEAWNGGSAARDTLITGSANIELIPISGTLAIVSGNVTAPWSGGLATFTNVIFSEISPQETGSIRVVNNKNKLLLLY